MTSSVARKLWNISRRLKSLPGYPPGTKRISVLTPMDAFGRLKKSGAFVDKTSEPHQLWFWHVIGGGFECMARRNADGSGAPTIYREFHINDSPLYPKRYF
ncbi:MAG: hypothetical protein KGI25_08675 [Thaumarchaeota archaeon]|nr:hypothetical protein [Nitrososphaerota archaeon]